MSQLCKSTVIFIFIRSDSIQIDYHTHVSVVRLKNKSRFYNGSFKKNQHINKLHILKPIMKPKIHRTHQKKRNKTQKQDNRNVLKSQLRKSSKSARFLRAQSSTHPSLRVSNTMPSQNMRDNKRRGSLRKLSVFAVGFAVGRTCGRRRRWPGAN